MRADGKRVTNVDPMYTLAPYFMRHRSDAQNAITVTVPYEAVHNYVLDARKRGFRTSHLAVVMAALVRTFSQFPCLNRFVVNSKIYAHNTLQIAMVVLRPNDNNPSMGKMQFDLYDNLYDVNEKIEKHINANNQSSSNTGADKLFKKLLSFGFLVRALMALLRFLDRHGLLPRAILNLSPFHGSAVLTNLASIRTNHIYHHVYDFGTMGMVFSMGNSIEAPKMKNGELTLEKQMPFGIVMDERIADGHTYALAFAEFERYLKNPVLLEASPETVKVDFPFEGLSERFKSEKTKKKEAKREAKMAKKEAKKEGK